MSSGASLGVEVVELVERVPADREQALRDEAGLPEVRRAIADIPRAVPIGVGVAGVRGARTEVVGVFQAVAVAVDRGWEIRYAAEVDGVRRVRA